MKKLAICLFLHYNVSLDMVTGKPHKPTKFTRFVLYPIAGVFFFAALTIVLTLANGYRFTYSNGKVGLIKTGMLIVTTRPFDATITMNGKLTKYKTGFYLLATKISALKPGNYDIEIKKAGYRTWRDTLEIKPNMVTWANYILLFAEKLNISKVDAPAGQVIAKSENGRHLLFSSKTDKFDLKSLDSNNISTKEFWPTTVPTEAWLANPVITSAEYSPNSDLVLLKITNGERTEYVVVDSGANPVKLIHLNTTLGNDFQNAWWNVANNTELYLQTSSGISLVSVNATSLPTPILDSAISFKVDESRQILYVTKDSSNVYSVNKMNLDGGNKTTLVTGIPAAKSYRLGYSTSYNTLTVLNNDTGELTAYGTSNANKKISTLLSTGVTSFGWSKSGEYLYYYGSDFVKRYDWAKNKETVASLRAKPNNLHWYFDESHYLVSDNSGIYEMDYDGSNVVPISEKPVSLSNQDTGNSNVLYATKDDAGVETYYKFISEF